MRIADRIENIRQQFPDCRTIVYADISANNVLASSAASQLGQEHLNDLCETAVHLLTGTSAEQVARVWSDTGSVRRGVYQAIIIELPEIGIFLRSVSNPTDALCCVCAPSINVAPFVTNAREHLEAIGQMAESDCKA